MFVCFFNYSIITVITILPERAKIRNILFFFIKNDRLSPKPETKHNRIFSYTCSSTVKTKCGQNDSTINLTHLVLVAEMSGLYPYSVEDAFHNYAEIISNHYGNQSNMLEICS